jgi:protocatechuate 3,4-dioxygenase alpha subunit
VSCLATADAKGERIWLRCRVLDDKGFPVPDAMLELWQANADGKYQHPEDRQEKPVDPHCKGFGRLGTDPDGYCVFETVKPGCVPGLENSVQAPHISVSVFARGILKRLATRVYFAGESTNENDPVLALVPTERRATLMAKRVPERPGHWSFEIHLCGEQETVFFDI